MSGTLVIQAAGADMSANPSQIILPGTLANGLAGHFYLNTSLANAAKNLAPGAIAGAATIAGAPAIGSGFLNFQSGVNYLNSGLIETQALTYMFAARSDDTLVTNDVYWASAYGTDAGQGSGSVGTTVYSFHGQAPGGGNMTFQTYFGASFATKAAVTLSLPSQNIGNWSVWALTVQGVSPWLVRARNLTTGAAAQSNGANPRQWNTTQPQQFGSRTGSVQPGIMQMASASVWNRDLSDAECAQMRSLVIAPYLLAKFGITV